MEFKQYYISTNFDLFNSYEKWLLLKDCFWCKNIPIENEFNEIVIWLPAFQNE